MCLINKTLLLPARRVCDVLLLLLLILTLPHSPAEQFLEIAAADDDGQVDATEAGAGSGLDNEGLKGLAPENR